MKVARQIALVSIIATSFGLQAADPVGQLKEVIYNRDSCAIVRWKGSSPLTSDNLAILSRTQFPHGSTTIRETSSDGYLRTIADEAVEQLIHDGNTENARRSGSVLELLARVAGVSFNPSEETLEKQRNYQQRFGEFEVPLKEFHKWGKHMNISVCLAEHLIKTNPKQALEGMDQLPPYWFNKQAENSQTPSSLKGAYKLLSKAPAKTRSMSSCIDDNTWYEGDVDIEPCYQDLLAKSNRIGLRLIYNFREYIFPETNSCSEGTWEEIAFGKYGKDEERYNYYLISDTGPLNPGIYFYRQEKDLGKNVKRAK